ncbi:DUF3291 domain-containing protein [Chryseobacterium sp.]|uniref:DUF3291 domain-containing protein n=1 Tax=Chryseobacterium sp. TaxID=1871047 RepID=UPI0025C0401E|nr:DUF3291 domain-containing protein [Chryseobacterium sp.]MBV8325141.1 DUF3291 domain-containing protein [Chryseobacterium sp.]
MYQLAQINIAKMKGVNIEDPVMKEFVENMVYVNQLADNSSGFVWRLKDEDNHAATLNPMNDMQTIINLSVWEDIESLQHYTYKTFHSYFLKRRKDWFHQYGKSHYALWWIKKGEYPGIEESLERLRHLQENGASSYAFTFQKTFQEYS